MKMNFLKALSSIIIAAATLPALLSGCGKAEMAPPLATSALPPGKPEETAASVKSILQSRGPCEPSRFNPISEGISSLVLSYLVYNDSLYDTKTFEKVDTMLLSAEKDGQTYLNLWNAVREVLPVQLRQHVHELLIFNDGRAGFALPRNLGFQSWAIGIQKEIVQYPEFTSGERDADLKVTLSQFLVLHEFGHTITMDSSYVEKDPPQGFGDINYRTGSIGLDFLTLYWNGNRTSSMPFKENDFVSENAAMNVSEDLAETFAYFVILDKPTDSSLTRNKKILRFYKDVEMVAKRTIIRSRIKL